MKKLPTPAKLGLLFAAVIAVLLVGWLAVIAPKRSDAAKLTDGDRGRSLRDRAHAGRHPTPSRTPSIRVADLFNLPRAMPNRADIPGVLLQLSHVAEETGVSFQSITPHDPVSLGTYQQIGIDLAFEGRFYDLSDFLYRLRNLVAVHGGALNATGRLFSVDSIAFEQGSLHFPQVKATLTVSAYNFGDGTAAPVPAAATAPSAACERGLAADPRRAARRDGRRSMSTTAAAAAAKKRVRRQKIFLAVGTVCLLGCPRFRAPQDARPARQPSRRVVEVTTASPIAAVASPVAAAVALRDTDRFAVRARHGPAALVRPLQEQGPVRPAARRPRPRRLRPRPRRRRRPCQLRRRRRRRA